MHLAHNTKRPQFGTDLQPLIRAIGGSTQARPHRGGAAGLGVGGKPRWRFHGAAGVFGFRRLRNFGRGAGLDGGDILHRHDGFKWLAGG